MRNILFFLSLLLLCHNSQSQIISTIAGTGSLAYSGDGGAAVSAGITNPIGGCFNQNGVYIFPDYNANRIRAIYPNGIIYTIGGNGVGTYGGDGSLATATGITRPQNVKLDTLNNVFIAQHNDNVIRKIDVSTGLIYTIAGTGMGAFSGDGGPATAAELWNPHDVAFDRKGNIYIADMFNHRVRKINHLGVISTIAGTGIASYSGDGGPATSAELSYPTGLALDDTGNVYIADPSSFVCRIRKVDTNGIITTIAGNGSGTYVGDGIPATSAAIAPVTVALDKQNNIYMSDRFNHRVYKVDKSTGILYCIAGNGTGSDAGDGGAATAAGLYTPTGVSIDDCGNVYIATIGDISIPISGRRIRKVTFNPPTTPTITLGGITTATVGATVTVSAAVSGAGGSYTIRWFRNSSLFSTTTTPTTTFVKGMGIDTITARIVPTIVYCYDSTTAAPHLVLETPVGVGYVPERQQYSVFPNPAQQQLSISSPAAIHTITISSPVGQQWLAYTSSGSTEVQLSVAHLPQGVYIVRVNNSYTTKMVKE
jgi:hypothetical protein